MLQNQTISAITSTLRAFDPVSDTLDILIISFAFYQLIQFARKSKAGQLVRGILLIVLFYGLAYVLNLRTVTWVLNNVVTIGFTAAVVIFQPELRRTLERMGQTTVRQPSRRPLPAGGVAERGGGDLRRGGAAFRHAHRRADGTGTP